MAKKALVTGANGFVGSHLVEALLTRGYLVKCLIRKTSDIRYIKNLPVDFVYGELSERDSLKKAITDVNYVFHVGAVTKAKNSTIFYKVNVEGTKNLYESCKEHNRDLERFLFVSSQAAAGPSFDGKPIRENFPCCPISDYGKSKYEAELFLQNREHELPITILRPPSVYGPRDKDVFLYFQWINRGIRPTLGDGNYYVNFIYVKDLVEAIIEAGESNKAVGETYFLANSEIYTWNDIAEIIEKILDRNTIKLKIPKKITYFMAFMSEIFANISGKNTIFNRQKVKEFTQKYWLCSSEKGRKDLGFETRSLEQGFREILDWYRKEEWL